MSVRQTRRKQVLLENLDKLSDNLLDAQKSVLQTKAELSNGSLDAKEVAVSCLELQGLTEDFFAELGSIWDNSSSQQPTSASCQASSEDVTERLASLETRCNILEAENNDLVKLRKVLNSLHLTAHRNHELKDKVQNLEDRVNKFETQSKQEHGKNSPNVKDQSSSKGRQEEKKEPNTVSGNPLHPGVMCDGCKVPVRGTRYKCLRCNDYDLCSSCFSRNLHKMHPMYKIPKPLQKVQTSSLPEEDDLSEEEKCVHRGVTCDVCRQTVHGTRYKCRTCTDYDMCHSCAKKRTHTHEFMYKIPKPLERVNS